jgi:hypothetical protein
MWDKSFAFDEPVYQRPERVLVAVITRLRDWETVRNAHWYRIPLARAPQRIGAEYLAFYHTGAFADLRWSIAYYAPIERYHLMRRHDLLPDEPDHPRAEELYYRLELGPLVALPQPIFSAKLRRVTFIHTTLTRLLCAREINDLWEREAARDRLSRALHLREVSTYPDYIIQQDRLRYVADLAIPCARRNLAIACVETAPAARIAESENNTLEALLDAHGWALQRLAVAEVMRDVNACVEKVLRAVEAYGGLVPT